MTELRFDSKCCADKLGSGEFYSIYLPYSFPVHESDCLAPPLFVFIWVAVLMIIVPDNIKLHHLMYRLHVVWINAYYFIIIH